MGVVDATTSPTGRASTKNTDNLTSTQLTLSANTRPIDPATMTLENASELVALPQGFVRELLLNRRLYYGDHWLDGEGWIGPWPTVQEGASRPEAAGVYELQEEIVRGFTSRNAVAECIERHTTGVVGTEPKWTWTPDGIKVRTPRQLRRPAIAPLPPVREVPQLDANGQPKPPTPPVADPAAEAAARAQETARAKVDELNSLFTKWWDDRNCTELFQSFSRSLLYGRVASLRLFIPSSAFEPETVDDNGTRRATGRMLLRVKNVADAFAKIHVEVVDADGGRVIKERSTLADIGVRFVKRGENQIAHATYLDPNGATVLAVIDRETRVGTDANTKPASTLTFELGGRLLMYTAVRESFITQQVRESQFALNYATSIIPRNLTTAGFLGRTLSNMHVPGHYEDKDGKRVFIPEPIFFGPHVVNVFQGHELEDGQGNKTMTTPEIHETNPVDPTPTIKAKNEHYSDILHECDQVHILRAEDAVTSGVSQEQARADHIASMGLTRSGVERGGRWLIETATALAHALADGTRNGVAAIDGYRASFGCYLDAGPVDAAERAQNTLDVAAGTLSVETAIERNQVSDVDAELERIDNARTMDLETKRAAVFAAWIAAGADESFAGWRAGLSPAEVDRLVAAFIPPTTGGEGDAGGGSFDDSDLEDGSGDGGGA